MRRHENYMKFKKYSNINNQVGNHIADAEKRYIRIGLVWRWTPGLVAHSNFVWIPNVVCEVHDMSILTHLQIFQPSFNCGCCITPRPVNALSCDGTNQFILSWFYYFLTTITFIYIYIYIYIYLWYSEWRINHNRSDHKWDLDARQVRRRGNHMIYKKQIVRHT